MNSYLSLPETEARQRIDERVATAARARTAKAVAPHPRRHQIATRLRRIADQLDN